MSKKKQTRSRVSNCNRPLPGALMGFAQMTLAELNTDHSRKLAELITLRRYGDVILQEPVKIPEYSNSSDFKSDYLATELLSKCPIDLGIDRESVALDTFEKTEITCRETNARFSPRGIQNWSFEIRSAMEAVRRKIEKILGPFDWDEAAHHFAFGPGSTSSLSRRKASTENKLQHGIDSTPGAALAAMTVWDFNRGWNLALDELHTTRPRIVKGCRIVTVPKNAKMDRVIAIEPDMNMFIQKGLGAVIRSRLKRAGLNLNTSWRTNHELAKIGSGFNSYATIDLSSASDTISSKLVEWLYPNDWFGALSLARSRQARLPSKDWVSLEKFSSMGNATTFESESLIFWAIATSVVERNGSKDHVSVFGDDIIVPVSCYEKVCQLLEHCGFTVNMKKTFRDGPFRESCGKHFFLGHDVTPFYLRKEESDILTLTHALNRAREWSIHPVYGLEGLESTYRTFQEKLPFKHRFPSIPYGYGDGSLWGELDECRPLRYRPEDGNEGWICDTLLPVTKEPESHPRFRVLGKLYKMEKASLTTEQWKGQPHHGEQFVRDVDKYLSFSVPPSAFADRWKRGHMLVTQWPHFGPWI